MKTSELTGRALEWAIATCEGWVNLRWHNWAPLMDNEAELVMDRNDGKAKFSLEDMHLLGWNQAGPIIEREGITTEPGYTDGKLMWWAAYPHASFCYDENGEFIPGSDLSTEGPTLIVAAMRCYCHTKLGEEVDVPKELL